MVFVGYMWQFYGPVQALASVSAMFQQAATAAERVFEILDTPAERLLEEAGARVSPQAAADRPVPPATDAALLPVPATATIPSGPSKPASATTTNRSLPAVPVSSGSPAASHDGRLYGGTVRGEIEFRHVSFSYEGDEYALRDINLRIHAGEMVGLVGSSGSGKTTLVNLIPRFYEPTAGEILIDGVPLRQWDLPTLRRQIGIVLQEPFLFHGTIGENIAYGNPDATPLDVIRAAQAANAHEFIMDLPDGYDSVIGERGVGLSGGQRQRISIARAILKNPRILILDEATSAVDTETEKLIQEALARLISNRTTLAIAHRLSTLRNADRIVVVDNGTLVESGTPEQLLESGGQFAYLWHLQTELSRA
ncbi:MAG: ATP-binding cassette domain-containing protein [Limnochordaceae bacterium]|nr:ATP-binding cassette domain-containing protein [Limnochordaceae bacterium]